MQTATEIVSNAHLQDTEWGKRIIEADKLGGFSHDDELDSSEWLTCACGKSLTDIQIDDESCAPVDSELQARGLRLWHRVREDDVPGAAKTLVEIEERAMLLHLQSLDDEAYD